MKKVAKLTGALFLIGLVLSCASYALGGRVPTSLMNQMYGGVQSGMARMQSEYRENVMEHHDGFDWDNDRR